MLDSVKKFDNLKFKQKLILVYCISLITSLFLSICLLVVFCINILKKNYINNLDVSQNRWLIILSAGYRTRKCSCLTP